MSHASYLIPIKTVTGLNAREHWRKRAARVKAERAAVAQIVRMVRLSSSLCDDDNLQGACKAIRDEIARICGVDDGPTGPITWVYAQEKCKRGQFGVRVEFLAI